MFDKKASIALSLNFLVTLIIGFVIFSLGLYFIKNTIFSGAEEISTQVSQDLENQIKSLLTQGKDVIIPLNKVTLNRGDDHIFGLGIHNYLGQKAEFRVEITDGLPLNIRDSTGCTPSAYWKNDVTDACLELPLGCYDIKDETEWRPTNIQNCDSPLKAYVPKESVGFFPTKTIDNNEEDIVAMGVEVPKDIKLDTYSFFVRVDCDIEPSCSDVSGYYGVQRIQITVI
jgi:hypothetical protein